MPGYEHVLLHKFGNIYSTRFHFLFYFVSFLMLFPVTKQNNTIQCITIQYNTMQYNALQYNTIQYNAMQCSAIQYNAIQYKTIQCNPMHYNTIQYNAIQYNAKQCNQYNVCCFIYVLPPHILLQILNLDQSLSTVILQAHQLVTIMESAV